MIGQRNTLGSISKLRCLPRLDQSANDRMDSLNKFSILFCELTLAQLIAQIASFLEISPSFDQNCLCHFQNNRFQFFRTLKKFVSPKHQIYIAV